MKAIRLALALAAVMAVAACGSDVTGPSSPTNHSANIVIGSPG